MREADIRTARVIPLHHFRPSPEPVLPHYEPHMGVHVPNRIRLCNCAGCGRELVSPLDRDWYGRLTVSDRRALPLLAGRVEDRPYCPDCLKTQASEE